MRVAVTMLARAPERGRVKTRLAAATGEAAACAIHAALMLDALEEAAGWLAARGGPPLVLALDGSDEARRLIEATVAATATCRIEDQSPKDLGERMRLALERRLLEGCDASLVIGSDCPVIGEALAAAAQALETCDAVLVPAADGGFVLLGLRRSLPEGCLDGLPWGTSHALEATRLRLVSLGLVPALAGGAMDVDDMAALRALAVRLRDEPRRAPRTREQLRQLGHPEVGPGSIRDTIAP